MPEMNGITLLKEIRGAGNDVPVVEIAGDTPNAPLTYIASLASTFGPNTELYKPLEKGELLNTIDAVMSREAIALG